MKPEPTLAQYEEAAAIVRSIDAGGMDTVLYLAFILARRDTRFDNLMALKPTAQPALEQKIANQAHELMMLQESNQDRNNELDAMGWVWCDGTCRLGIFRHHHDSKLTEELVLIAERNTARMRRKLYNLGIVPIPWWRKAYYVIRWQVTLLRLWRKQL